MICCNVLLMRRLLSESRSLDICTQSKKCLSETLNSMIDLLKYSRPAGSSSLPTASSEQPKASRQSSTQQPVGSHPEPVGHKPSSNKHLRQSATCELRTSKPTSSKPASSRQHPTSQPEATSHSTQLSFEPFPLRSKGPSATFFSSVKRSPFEFVSSVMGAITRGKTLINIK